MSFDVRYKNAETLYKAGQYDKAILVLDDQGGQTTEVRQEDLSEYSVAGDIVDTRDGNVTVYMGKPTALELAQAQLAAAEAALEEGVNSLG